MSTDVTKVQIDPGVFVREAAAQVWVAARRKGREARAEFNGTPMVAYPGDASGESVFLRWHYERIIIQIRNGVLRPEDVVLS